MNANEISRILERLRQRLPEIPDWIALGNVDGLYIAGANVVLPLSAEYADFPPVLSASYMIMTRVHSDLNLGDSELVVTSGKDGLFLIQSLHDDYLLGIKFGKEIDYTSLANIADSLPLALEELLEKLRRYSP